MHRVSRHSSTKCSPFFFIYNRDLVLPTDVKFSLAERDVTETEVFAEETFEAILESATRIRGEIHESATTNIRKAQDKQKKDFDGHHIFNSKIKVGDLMLLRKFSFAWLGPYISFPKLHPKKIKRLNKRDGEILKVKRRLLILVVTLLNLRWQYAMRSRQYQLIQEPAPLRSVTRFFIGNLYQMNW